MASKFAWPEIVRREYDYFNDKRKCLNAEVINALFNFTDPKRRLILDYPPCFFAGKVGQSKFVLLSLNPGYNEKRNKVEREIYDKLGWEKTYLTFFDWFSNHGIASPYYSRFAVFLSGLLGKQMPEGREKRFKLLSENLVNLDLIPYHSTGISLGFEFRRTEKLAVIKPYLSALNELLKLCEAKVLFINGAAFKPLLNEIGFHERSSIGVNDKFTAHIGECSETATAWFDKFISGRSAGATNKELYDLGLEIRACLKL